MKRFLAVGLAAAGIFAFSPTDANAQYYYGGYYGGGYSYYPSYGYPAYYASPGLSLNFSYFDNDRRGGYRGHGYYGGHGSHRGHGHGYGHGGGRGGWSGHRGGRH